jgi:multisubunit Na+/H+ antiporter MnhC subunit
VIDPVTYFSSLVFTALIINAGLALYGLWFRPSLTKKLLMLITLGNTVSLLAVYLGYKRWTREKLI